MNLKSKNIRVSFDFDGTLDKATVQEYARALINRGVDVWICTARLSDKDAPSDKWNDDLYEVCKLVGIPKRKIQFCAMSDKYEFFLNTDFVWHLDDDWTELELINEYTNTKGISIFGNPAWKDECEKHIQP